MGAFNLAFSSVFKTTSLHNEQIVHRESKRPRRTRGPGKCLQGRQDPSGWPLPGEDGLRVRGLPGRGLGPQGHRGAFRWGPSAWSGRPRRRSCHPGPGLRVCVCGGGWVDALSASRARRVLQAGPGGPRGPAWTPAGPSLYPLSPGGGEQKVASAPRPREAASRRSRSTPPSPPRGVGGAKGAGGRRRPAVARTAALPRAAPRSGPGRALPGCPRGEPLRVPFGFPAGLEAGALPGQRVLTGTPAAPAPPGTLASQSHRPVFQASLDVDQEEGRAPPSQAVCWGCLFCRPWVAGWPSEGVRKRKCNPSVESLTIGLPP